ncbi:hypothetical protein DNHGIG_30790 [Collibacillus ludicampi]|uniref:Uncharacterized protein n=1 Tax=Collibacillus ludicampi TaxID=2771369 RepID=A0AAV4LI69_9BACL|nr:hypothetical protein DNHGIG_30790 [Collibacillus ludicampi]
MDGKSWAAQISGQTGIYMAVQKEGDIRFRNDRFTPSVTRAFTTVNRDTNHEGNHASGIEKRRDHEISLSVA